MIELGGGNQSPRGWLAFQQLGIEIGCFTLVADSLGNHRGLQIIELGGARKRIDRLELRIALGLPPLSGFGPGGQQRLKVPFDAFGRKRVQSLPGGWVSRRYQHVVHGKNDLGKERIAGITGDRARDRCGATEIAARQRQKQGVAAKVGIVPIRIPCLPHQASGIAPIMVELRRPPREIVAQPRRARLGILCPD